LKYKPGITQLEAEKDYLELSYSGATSFNQVLFHQPPLCQLLI